MKMKIFVIFCFLSLSAFFELAAQTNLLVVQINDQNCVGASGSGNYTVSNTTYDYYMTPTGHFSAFWVNVNGQPISNYVAGSVIPVTNGDVITIGIVAYPNPFGPPCGEGIGEATLYRIVRNDDDNGTD